MAMTKNKIVKRILVAALALCTLLSLLPITAFAESTGTCGDWGDNIKWVLDDDGTLTFTGSGAMNDFRYDYDLENKVSSPWHEFGIHKDIKKIVVGEGITSIGDYAFYDCENVTQVTLPSTLTHLGIDVFYDCQALTAVTIPSKIKVIPDDTFYGCHALNEVNLPQGLEKIDRAAFMFCESLESLSIPDSATQIGESAFYYCRNLTTVNIPKKLTQISDWTFALCYNLSGNLEIPEGVKSIGSNAFYDCRSISRISIPASVNKIGYSAFDRCANVEKYEVDENNESYTSKDGILYSKDMTTLVYYPPQSTRSSFTVPETVTSLSYGTFKKAKNLVTVTLPPSLVSINYAAFGQCSSLETVIITNPEQSNLRSIEGYAFDECKKLKNFTVPEGVTEIGSSAFGGCVSLTIDDINIPSTVTKLGGGAYTNTAALKNMAYTDGMKYIDNWLVAYKYDGNTILEIKEGTIGLADYVLRGKTEITEVKLPASLRYIGDEQFIPSLYGASNIKSITAAEDNPLFLTIDGNLYSKDKTQFLYYAPGKTDESFVIPEGVESIGNDAFYENNSLKTITLPSSLKVIDENAFYQCKQLQTLNLPEGLQKISTWAFQYCENLENISLPNSLTSVESTAFLGTAYYQNDENWNGNFLINNGWLLSVRDLSGDKVTIPDSVTSIADYAFVTLYGDEGITTVMLPSSIRRIGENAFVYLKTLTDVYFDGSEELWNTILIDEYNPVLQGATIHFTNYIDTVEVTGATLSFNVGDAVKFTGEVPSGADYIIDHESWTGGDKGWTSSDFWNKRYGDFEGSWGKQLTEFEANTQYEYSIYLKCSDGNRFTDDVKLKLNGKIIPYEDMNHVEFDNETGETVWYFGVVKMTPTPKQTQNIESVEITGATLSFNDGDAPVFTGKVLDADADKYTLVYERFDYVDPTDPNKVLASVSSDGSTLGSSVEKLTKFEAGKKYYYSVWIEPKDGYSFKQNADKNWLADTTLKINGEQIRKESVTLVGSGKLYAPRVIVLQPTPPSHVHSLTLVPEKDADCLNSGNKAYYTCSGCDDWFYDENGTDKITDKSQVTIPAKGHDLSDWIYDETNHYKECNRAGCGAIEQKAAHTSTGDNAANCQHKAKCDICGAQYGALGDHSYSPELRYDENNHYHECLVCGDKKDIAAHTPDHEGGATEDYAIKCKDCGYVIEQQLEHTHSFTQENTNDTFLKSAATCNDPAVYYKSCRCGEKGTETFVSGEALGHDYKWTYDETQHWQKCSRCGDVLSDTKAAHDLKDDACDICGYVKAKPNYEITEGNNGTWTQNSNNTLVFRSNGEPGKLESVKVDGKLLSDKDYDKGTKTAEVTLKPEYLSTLSTGKHTITLVYTDGECSAKFEIKAAKNPNSKPNTDNTNKNTNTPTQKPTATSPVKSPRTSDNGSAVLWAMLLVLSGGASIALAVAYGKKRTQK